MVRCFETFCSALCSIIFHDFDDQHSQFIKSKACFESVAQAAFMDDEQLQKTPHMSAGLNGDEDQCGMEDCKPVTFLFIYYSVFSVDILAPVLWSLV